MDTALGNQTYTGKLNPNMPIIFVRHHEKIDEKYFL